MEKEFKNYEIGFLMKTEQDREDLVKILKDRQFLIIDDGEFSRIKLAYPIKKENFAYFGYLYFSGNPKSVKELENELKVLPKILRFIIISQSVIIEKNKEWNNQQSIISEKVSSTPTPIIDNLQPTTYPAQKQVLYGTSNQQPVIEKLEKPRSGSLSNEELEKKLEEILK